MIDDGHEKPWYLTRHDSPSEATLAWASAQVHASEASVTATFLPGGSSSAIHILKFELIDGAEDFAVIRRWIRPDWQRVESYLSPENEAQILELATNHSLRAPKLLGIDSDGLETDFPTVLMSLLPGAPHGPDEYSSAELSSMAKALVEIHSVPAPDWLATFRWYNSAPEVRPPVCASDLPIWATAFELAKSHAPRGDRARESLVHRDFNPTNLLWHGSHVQGIVDWGSACAGERATDVAHMRWNLAVTAGTDAADEFVVEYENSNSGYRHSHYFDLRAVVDLLPEHSIQPLTKEICERLESYLHRTIEAIRKS